MLSKEKELPKGVCDGRERHGHWSIDKRKYIYHTHEHTVSIEDFNSLHHHPPMEHRRSKNEQ